MNGYQSYNIDHYFGSYITCGKGAYDFNAPF